MAVRRMVALGLLLLMVGMAAAALAAEPTEQLRTTVDAVIAALKDKSMANEVRRQRITNLIRAKFDFQTMSRGTLATNWKKASLQEQARFIELFSDLLEATYIGRIEAYTDERVEYAKEQIRGRRALVDTLIVTKHEDIPITYRMVQKGGGEWLVYDVVIEEVSLVRNYRSSYNEIVRNEGIAGLLVRMEEKLEELRSAEATGAGQ